MNVQFACKVSLKAGKDELVMKYSIRQSIRDERLAFIMLSHAEISGRNFYQKFFSDDYATTVIGNGKVKLESHLICPCEPRVYKFCDVDEQALLYQLVSDLEVTPVAIFVKDRGPWRYSYCFDKRVENGILSFKCFKRLKWLPFRCVRSFKISLGELLSSKVDILEEVL